MNSTAAQVRMIRQADLIPPEDTGAAIARPACVLLMSGGVESSTLLYGLADTDQIHPIFLDYGQRAAVQEWRAVKRIAATRNITPRRFDLSAFGNAVGALRTERYHVPLPHRNFVAIAAVASIASNLKVREIIIGLTADDAMVDPCSRLPFQRAIRDALSSLSLRLDTPYDGLTKTEVVKRGCRLGVPWETSYSCLLGRAEHCGYCPQCQKRRAAFTAAGASQQDVRYNR